jgi:hemin uptake protein HemP
VKAVRRVGRFSVAVAISTADSTLINARNDTDRFGMAIAICTARPIAVFKEPIMLLSEMTSEKPESLENISLPVAPPVSEVRAPVYSSAELLQGSREAWIEHGQQMYRLRLTHAGKLYLTK